MFWSWTIELNQRYLSALKCDVINTCCRRQILEMVQAFGDIFKNIFPQHMWHFWKPSKYFILPAGCLNFESCLCQQMLKQFYLFKAFFYSHSYFKHLKIEMSAKSLNFWAQTAFFAVKRHFREKIKWYFCIIPWNVEIGLLL